MATEGGSYQAVGDQEYDTTYEDAEELIDYEDDDSRPKFEHSESHKDWPYAMLFLTQVLAVCVFAIVATTKPYEVNDSSVGSFAYEERIEVMEMVTVAGLIALSTSMLWVTFVQLFGPSAIVVSLWLGVGTTLIASTVVALFGTPTMAICMFALLCASFFYTMASRRRLGFSSAMLKLVLKIVSECPAVVVFSLCVALIQALWLTVWSFLLVSIFTRGNVVTRLQMVGMTLSFLFTSQVLKNMVHMTVSGAVATWYFLHETGMPMNVTMTSFKRALTTSLGSVCLGSTLVGPCRTIVGAVDLARRSNNGLATFIASCVMGVLDKVVSYFNVYAFTQVAIYGKPFLKSGSDVWELISARGVDQIVKQNRIGTASLAICYISGMATALCGGLWASQYDNMNVSFVTLLCFGIGWTINAVVVEVVESTTAAVLVCYADDPEVLSRSDPIVFSMIREGCSSAPYV